MSSEVEAAREVTFRLGHGTPDFARNDSYVKKFLRTIVDLA